ncbi:MAG: leucine-rich repeat protein [Clostridia bacterium]|nr:leucine-rich repeat protein [Clostridia bacterium]MBO5870326.1 leucine-rich repeat protein [Clostridia bacterium]
MSLQRVLIIALALIMTIASFLTAFSVFAEQPEFSIGDVNADGEINSADYLLIKRACFGTYKLNGEEITRADINGSDVIDSADYLLLKRVCFGTYVIPTPDDNKPPSNNTEEYTKGLRLGECMWGNGYSVWGIGTATDTDIIIPSTYNGKPVIEIYENAFKDCTNIISVSIPSSVLTIGTEAFSGCISLETVSITEGLTGIQSKAFYNCDSLKQINVPNSIENISKDSFEDCDNLKYNEFNDGLYLGNQSNPYVVLMTAKSCEDLFINNETAIIAHNALSDNLEIKQVVVSDSVRFIGRNAFLGCKNLTNITFGDGLERIYINAFKNCTALKLAVFSPNHTWGVNKYGYNTNLTIIPTNDANTNAYNLKNKYCEYFWERAK